MNQGAFICNNSGSGIGGTQVPQGTLSSNASARQNIQSINVPKLDPKCIKLIEENLSLLASFMTAYENFAMGKLVEPSSLDEDFDQIGQEEMDELDFQLNMALLVGRAKKFLQQT
ncbi:hypothetical protein Hanom_Chr01g00054711 [Helianthus anomalus]